LVPFLHPKAKKKYVEISFHKAQRTRSGIVDGLLMLTCSDSRTSTNAKRFQIIQVKKQANVPQNAFSLVTYNDKELVFACEDEKIKEEWVSACNDGVGLFKNEVEKVNRALQEPS